MGRLLLNKMDNTQKVKNSVLVIPTIFRDIENYRILGSLLVASLNGKPHRELHDIDLLIDERNYKEIVARFQSLGFQKVTKHAFSFEWNEFSKPDHLTFGILMKGKFNKDYFEFKANKFLELRVNIDYLKPTDYELYGVQVKGIPLRSIYEGIKIANFNTKRKVDREIVFKQTDGSMPSGMSLNQAFHVKMGGIEIPYLYTAFSQTYNIIGGIRLRFGKPYDTWS